MSSESKDEAILSETDISASKTYVPETVSLDNCSRNLLETQAVPETPEKKEDPAWREARHLYREVSRSEQGRRSPVVKKGGKQVVKMRNLDRLQQVSF